MAYRDRDPLEKVGNQVPPTPVTDKRPSLLRSLKHRLRDAIMRQVSTKQ